MNLSLVSSVLIFLFLLNSFTAVSSNPTSSTGDVSINCGSSGTSSARDGRGWLGDARARSTSLVQVKGSSTASSVMGKLVPADDPVPLKTARVSLSRFSYAFQLYPGQKILRLHFNPAGYRGFKRFEDLFSVEAGPFTLLSNFSASLTADALGVRSLVKEYCIYVEENQQFNLIFYPESSQSFRTYAFINGIEIMSAPVSHSYFQGGDIGVQVVGKSPVYVDYFTALEIIHRFNIQKNLASSTGEMFGIWESHSEKKRSKMKNNITWKTTVNVGFRYLVRIHFSEIGLKMADIGGVTFEICINDKIVDTHIDIVGERGDENSIPWYREYVVMMKGHKQDGRSSILITLLSNGEFLDGHGPIKAFEIMKLTNPDNSLASPNPLCMRRDPSHWVIQNLYQVLGWRDMIATVAIILLTLVNIITYTLRQIWETTDREEKSMPSARAVRLCRRFSLAEIRLATRNFSDAHLIGKGGFGRVYKGLIENGSKSVAIKRLKSSSKQGAREFLTEIETLSELRHDNLVSLIGYCNENREMILVYEYMASGTLADHLYKLVRNMDNHTSLTWKQRLIICIGAARGLDYLHTGNSIIHRDVKASNILLDENFVAKVSDFGLATHLGKNKLQSHVSTKVKGTFGYIDPSYFTTGRLTRKSDTYAFGVVLLEVLSGRPAVEPWVVEEERILVVWARENITKGNVDEIVGLDLKGEISEESLKAFVGVTERCLLEDPKKRPTMAQVVLQLELALEQQERPRPLKPNGTASDVNDINPSGEENGRTSYVHDIHRSTEETNLSVSPAQLIRPSIDEQNCTSHPSRPINRNVVTTESILGIRDGRNAPTHKSSRRAIWDAFWNRVKPSDKSEMLLSGNSAGDRVRETEPMDKLYDRKTNNVLPIVIPATSLEELKDITDNFSLKYLIGEGSIKRNVYRGVLKSGQAAAIKKLAYRNQEFLEQVSSLKHENLVQLFGCFVDGNQIVLAYEFAPNGSLHDTLHGRQRVAFLSWAQRVKIAVGAAKGLEYIHEKQHNHCNIKSTNVLLFNDVEVAKLADPIAKLRHYDEPHPNGVLKPRGYVPPGPAEYSQKSDVYSFGVVLLELLTGRKVFDITQPREQQCLVTWATPRLSEERVHQCVDARLKGYYPPKAAAEMASIAALCVQYEAQNRADMNRVVKLLESILDVPSPW